MWFKLHGEGERIDHARCPRCRAAPCVSRVRFAVPVKGLRIVGWGAGLTALIGGAAVALLMGHMPLHAGSPAASMLYGATFAPVGNDRPGLVVTSLRSEVDDAGLRSAVDKDRAAAVRPPLHVGDTILAVDDRPATSFSLLREEASRAGDAPVRLRVARDHGLITITLLRSGSGGLRGQQDFADRR